MRTDPKTEIPPSTPFHYVRLAQDIELQRSCLSPVTSFGTQKQADSSISPAIFGQCSVASSFLKLIETRSERRGDIRRRQTDKGAIQSRPARPALSLQRLPE